MLDTGHTVKTSKDVLWWFYRRRCISPFLWDLCLHSRNWSAVVFMQALQQAARVTTSTGTTVHWMR